MWLWFLLRCSNLQYLVHRWESTALSVYITSRESASDCTKALRSPTKSYLPSPGPPRWKKKLGTRTCTCGVYGEVITPSSTATAIDTTTTRSQTAKPLSVARERWIEDLAKTRRLRLRLQAREVGALIDFTPLCCGKRR